MPPPNQMKKHRTFDHCDRIADMDPHSQMAPPPPPPWPPQSNDLQTTTLSSSNNKPNDKTTTTADRNHHSNDKLNDLTTKHSQKQTHQSHDEQTKPVDTTCPLPGDNLNSMPAAETGQRLSKLVLSLSLHQLADSKYHTNKNHQQPNANDYYQHQTQINQNNTIIMNNENNASMQRSAAPAGSGHKPLPNYHPATTAPFEHRNNENDDQILANDRQSSIPSSTKPTNMTNNEKFNANPNQQQHQKQQQQPKQNISHHQNKLSALTKQREAKLDTVHVVVGNESCDLDSAVSCLLMFHIISKMSDEINGKDKTRTLYIPLLNTTRDMLDSKCEVLWFLQKTLNIDKSFLTCKDDIDWNEIKKNGVEVLVTLVDHNYNEEFKDIGKIVEIIDHHQVQNPQWLMENQSQIRLTLDTQVGSCTTLVAERLFYIYAEHHVSDEILLLIYGTVLLDTICLSEKAKRFTRRDVYLLKKLDSLLGSKRPIRDELYRQLVEIKNSTRELNFEKLMKRDLKIYKDKHGTRIGIASLFGMAAREALGLAANIDLDLFFRQNQYEAFIIMGLIADLDHSDSISRDLVLISANRSLFGQLCQMFEQDTSKLDLQPIGSDSSPDPEDNIINNKKIVDSSSDLSKATISNDATNANSSSTLPFYKARIWLQRNVTSSRKVVAPLVLKVLHDSAQ